MPHRKPNSPYWHYDFWVKGHRFHGSTGAANKREAEQFERIEREKAKLEIDQAARSAVSLKIDDVAGRYWLEVGQHHAGADTTERDIARLVDRFGPTKLLSEITDDDVARLVAWRRGHRRKDHRKNPPKDAPPLPFISPATVNRSTTEVLKKLFTRAKAWGVRFDSEPQWKRHWLEEPEEIVRELKQDEADKLEDATRSDYLPIFDFADVSGLRLNECLLRWDEVNWDVREIQKKGKGKRRISVPITDTIRTILWPLRGQHPEFVFTYLAVRTVKAAGRERVKGQRYPVTYNGLKTVWKRLRRAAGVTGFRFHDKRHDLATKLLRKTGNLKIVQRALNHANIKTTTKYAHITTDDLTSALDQVQKSRTKSRRTVLKVS